MCQREDLLSWLSLGRLATERTKQTEKSKQKQTKNPKELHVIIDFWETQKLEKKGNIIIVHHVLDVNILSQNNVNSEYRFN